MENQPDRIHAVRATNELLTTYRHWKNNWGETLTNVTRKANEPEWWDRATELCVSQQISGPTLFWACWRYLNARPEDMVFEFQPTLFRAQALMRRSIQNMREVLVAEAERLEVIFRLRNLNAEMRAPKGCDDLLRMLSRLILEYFVEKSNVHFYKFTRAGAPSSEALRDTVRFSICRQNPYLLLATAETQHMQGLALLLSRRMSRLMPWCDEVWGHLMPDDWTYKVADQAKYFSQEEEHHSWPLDPWATPYLVGDHTKPRPALPLFEGVADSLTDSYLISLLDQGKKGR